MTKLCRAFTGVTSEVPITRVDIANMVFWIDVLKDFIKQVADLLASPESGMTDINRHSLESAMLSSQGNRINDVLGSSLQDWISPTEPPSTIDELNEGIFLFQRTSDLIKICSKIFLKEKY